MKTIHITAVILLLTSFALATEKLPMGKLGYPIGTYLTIEGHRAKDNIKGGSKRNLLVDTVNGKKLQKSITMDIKLGRRYLPKDTMIRIRGYESGRMVGKPHDPTKVEPEPLQQTTWHFYKYFVMTSCLEPKILPEDQRRSGSFAERLNRRRKELENLNTNKVHKTNEHRNN